MDKKAINIDAKLLKEASSLYGVATDTETVQLGLEAHFARRRSNLSPSPRL